MSLRSALLPGRKVAVRSRGGTARPRTVGLVALALIALGVYVAFSGVPFVHGFRVQGVFASSNQLRSGSPVRIAGVDVGKVAKIMPGPGTTQILTLELEEEGQPVHSDATLKIRPRVFLEGGYFVDMRPGSPAAPIMRDNDVIPLGQTSLPVQFSQVLNGFDRASRTSLKSIVTELDRALDGGGAEGLRESAVELGPTLRDAAVVTEAARGTQPHELSQLLESAARVTGVLAAYDRELAGLITNLRRTTGALADNDGALRASLRQLDGVLRETPPALDAVDRALPPTERFTKAVRPALRMAPPVLERVPPVLTQVNGLSQPQELPALLAYLREPVDQLPQLENRLGDLFPLVTPVIECVRDRALPVLTAKINDGKLSTGRPVWQDLLHAFVGLASASQNFDANGPYVRYLVGLGDETVSLGPAPGLGELFTVPGFGPVPGTPPDQEIEGARPLWLGPGVKPPFRPDQECRDQKLPDLDARTGNG